MDFSILTAVLVVTTFVAATATVAAFLMYAAAQSPNHAADPVFQPPAYQPMKMLTRREAPAPGAPPAPPASPVRLHAAA
jgi:hypothetical protein